MGIFCFLLKLTVHMIGLWNFLHKYLYQDKNKENINYKKFATNKEQIRISKHIIQNDSILVNVSEIIEFELGDTALLRFASKDYYVLNEKKDSIWWNVFLNEKKNDGMILVSYPKKGELSILEKILKNDDLEIRIPYVEEHPNGWSVQKLKHFNDIFVHQ